VGTVKGKNATVRSKNATVKMTDATVKVSATQKIKENWSYTSINLTVVGFTRLSVMFLNSLKEGLDLMKNN